MKLFKYKNTFFAVTLGAANLYIALSGYKPIAFGFGLGLLLMAPIFLNIESKVEVKDER